TGDTLHGERHRRSVAVEAMTCPPDAFRSGRDIVAIKPGETWRGSWGIRPGAARPSGEERVEFEEVVRRRRMVRNYDPDRPVPPEVRERMLEQALHAPSAGFSQGWGFLVLEELADRDRFWAAATPETDVWQQWLTNMRTAPLI